jgi:hypothetical protein
MLIARYELKDLCVEGLKANVRRSRWTWRG